VDRLSRRPLRTLQVEGIAQPYKSDSLINRLRRRFIEKFKPSVRNKAKRNRDERSRYRKRMPQQQDGRRNNAGRKIGPKRKAVDKRLGVGRLRGPSGGLT
jgi:hypothetical protein